MKNKWKREKRAANEKIGVLKVLKYFQEGEFLVKLLTEHLKLWLGNKGIFWNLLQI